MKRSRGYLRYLSIGKTLRRIGIRRTCAEDVRHGADVMGEFSLRLTKVTGWTRMNPRTNGRSTVTRALRRAPAFAEAPARLFVNRTRRPAAALRRKLVAGNWKLVPGSCDKVGASEDTL
jgi:hypothetical protein